MLKGFTREDYRKMRCLRGPTCLCQKDKTMLLEASSLCGWGVFHKETRILTKSFVPYQLALRLDGEKRGCFSRPYFDVDSYSLTIWRPVQDLSWRLSFLAPSSRDAPKAGSRRYCSFALKLLRCRGWPAQEGTITSLQDPASKHASGGSKAPPSKKT
ncbi:hypothetical protein Tco_1133713 [Tanacetum coccineum]